MRTEQEIRQELEILKRKAPFRYFRDTWAGYQSALEWVLDIPAICPQCSETEFHCECQKNREAPYDRER